jgi:hypothetical protein
METKIEYKSYSLDKTIEELKYNLLQQRETFRNLIIEQEFCKKLLNVPIYKSHKLNLLVPKIVKTMHFSAFRFSF